MAKQKTGDTDLNKLSFNELQEKICELEKQKDAVGRSTDHPWQIGEKYLIRTVTMILTGRLKAVYDQELVLEKAAWIADTGRFMEATDKGNFDEVEPWRSREVIIGRGSVIDAGIISFDLPSTQK